MRITIIGANSYITRNLIHELKKEEDCTLFLYDYQEEHLDGETNYESINILEMEAVAKIQFDVDIIYMFIGKTGTAQGFEDFETYINVNEKALLNVLNCYRKANSKAKIVFPSTRLVYRGSSIPQTEDAEKEFKTVYGINKYACEQYLWMYHNMFDISYCILRICVPYGTMVSGASSYGTAEFMLEKASKGENISIYGDGSVRRTLIHMNDLVSLLILCGKSKECMNDVYNLGGEDYSLAEMAELIAKKYKVAVDYVPWPDAALRIESGSTVFDTTKLERLVPYKLKMSFSQWIGSNEE